MHLTIHLVSASIRASTRPYDTTNMSISKHRQTHRFGFDFKVESFSGSLRSGEVDESHFLEADVKRRFVDEDEPALERVKESRRRFV